LACVNDSQSIFVFRSYSKINFQPGITFFCIFTQTLKQKLMKKSLFFLSLFVAAIINIKAQCTITPGCSTAATGYCSTPASGTSLPNATELAAYSTVIQLSIGTSLSGVTINNGTLTSVTGLPTGLSYSLNPTNGVISAGGNGCMLIAGTPASGSAGSYTVTGNVTANTSFGAFPTTITWPLTVDAATTGIANFSANTSNMLLAPNPVKSELSLTADFHFQKVRIFDALGNVSLTQEVTGVDKVTLDLNKLNSGIYFIQIADGNKIVTRKFIKE
jgi:hypothetical protein